MTRLTIMPWRPSTLMPRSKAQVDFWNPKAYSRVLDGFCPPPAIS
jgi:hypothetical protein